LKLNVVGKIPEILLDNTDRNRTSPFAFTGNKFEFRAVGSQANCAQPMTILNTIMTKQLIEFKATVDALIEGGMKKDDAIFNVLRDYIKSSQAIRFEGDGYSQGWADEAEKRGLSNVKTSPLALDFYVSEKAVSLFEEIGVMNRIEVEARHEIMLEEYMLKIQIESRVLGDMAGNHIVPTAINYQNKLIQNVKGLKEVLSADVFQKLAKDQLQMIEEISTHISTIISEREAMVEERKKCNSIESARDRAIAYCDNVIPYFGKIRYAADKLEMLIDDELWPLPKYRELIFI
jgi:glutamine synthetase